MRNPALTYHASTLVLYPLLLVILSLMTQHPLFLAMMLSVIMFGLWMAGGLGKFMYTMRFILPLLLLILLLNILINKNGATVLYKGDVDLFVIGKLRITLEAVTYGVVMAVRMLAVVAAFAMYMAWLPGDRAFALFAKLAGRSAVTTMLASRLITYLGEQSEQVRDVMKTRGVRFEQGGLWKRLNAHRPLLNVVLISSLEGSWSVAEAMEARGFGQGKRSSYQRERWSLRDLVASLAMLVALVTGILFSAQDVLGYEFYPRMQSLVLDASLWLNLAVLTLLLLIPPVLTKRRRS